MTAAGWWRSAWGFTGSRSTRSPRSGEDRLLARMGPVLAKVEALVPAPETAVLVYTYACGHARLGKAAVALELLARAVERGFSRADADMKSLRDEPQFIRAVNR